MGAKRGCAAGCADALFRAAACGAVSVLASQDERVTLSAEAGGQTSVTFSLLGLIPVHETRVNVVEARKLIPGGQAVGVALKTRGVLVVSDSAKGRMLRAGDVILSRKRSAPSSAGRRATRFGSK